MRVDGAVDLGLDAEERPASRIAVHHLRPTGTMRIASFVAGLVIASSLVSCGGVRDSGDWQVGACGKHEQCRADEACVLGRCVGGLLDEEMDVTAINASQWFASESGSCEFDDECGPWVCYVGECTLPQDARRPMLPRREYRYWDTSCHSASDCGPWECSAGWCTQPGFASPRAVEAPYAIDESLGAPCLGDAECPPGADCVYPGYCREDAADEQMTFVDIAGGEWYANADLSCRDDRECGPHACDQGRCVAQEFTDRPRQLRSAYFYFDASCSVTEECGEWSCVDGWCLDPAYLR